MEQWTDSSVSPQALRDPQIQVGSIVETVTFDGAGNIDGTALVVISGVYMPDTCGRFLEVRFGGASSPAQSSILGMIFPGASPPGTAMGVLHLCAGPRDGCTVTAPGRHVIHGTHFRLRCRDAITEAWALDLTAIGAPTLAGVKEELTDLKKIDVESKGSDDDSSGSKVDVKTLKKKLLEKKLQNSELAASDRLVLAGQLNELKGSGEKQKKKDAKRRKKEKKKKKDKKSKKRKRSSSTGTSESTDDALFGIAPSRKGGPHGLVEVHEKSPGHIYDQALDQMASLMGERGGAKNPEAAKLWIPYLQTHIMANARSEDLPGERLQELRTLCDALTKAGAGQYKELVDVLAARVMALEARSTGRRDLAKGLELVDSSRRGLATPGHLRAAKRALRSELELTHGVERRPR